MLVLENLAHRFIKPNILELKLGNQLEDLLLSNINAPKEDQQQLERSTFLQVHPFHFLLYVGIYEWTSTD